MDIEPQRAEVSFIVRVSRDGRGRLSGVVERVRTGEKRRFQSADGIAALIERMAAEAARQRAPQRGKQGGAP